MPLARSNGPMLPRFGRSFVLVASLLLLGQGFAEAARVPIPGRLLAESQDAGMTRVLVEFETGTASARLGRRSPAFDAARAREIATARENLRGTFRSSGARVLREFATVPWIAVEVDTATLRQLALTPGVRRLTEDRLSRPLLRETATIVGAPEAEAMGFDGRGWSVAVIDTGIESGHVFLEGRVLDEVCFSGNRSCPNGATQQFGSGAGAPCSFAASACGHGTHVAGIAAGRGQNTDGMAPEAGIVSLQVFSRFTGDTCGDDSEDPCALTYTSDTIAALDWIYQNRDRLNVASVNMSLGGESYTSSAACDAADAGRKAAIDALRAVGIPTVVAAGNDGSSDRLATPGCLSSAISVGATTDEDEIASFSQSANFLDFLAPGRNVVSSYPPGSWASVSGTSQATPHLAGGFALLYQKLGSRDLEAALEALRGTGAWITDPRNGVAVPRIRLGAALIALGATSGAGVQVTPDGKRTLVSKDVGDERWAITLDHVDGSVTGNVFRAEGGAPQFVWCEPVAGAPLGQQAFSCEGSDSCAGGACTPAQWAFIDEVDVPAAFFRPEGSGQSAEAAAAVAGAGGSEGRAAASSAGRAALGMVSIGAGTPADLAVPGLQITPDGTRTLVNKDVDVERWAIGRNADNTVTGNVFLADGSDPKFVWCEQIGSDGNPDPAAEMLTLSCSGADRCLAESCDAGQWTWLNDVILPGAFFLP